MKAHDFGVPSPRSAAVLMNKQVPGLGSDTSDLFFSAGNSQCEQPGSLQRHRQTAAGATGLGFTALDEVPRRVSKSMDQLKRHFGSGTLDRRISV